MLNNWFPKIINKSKPSPTHKALPLMDNHRTHFYEDVSNVAKEKGILLKFFSPNMTHLLQPCDSCVFSQLKNTHYNKFCTPNPFSMSRYRSSLAEALPDAVAAASAPSTIRSSFIKTGIWPVMVAHVLERIAGSPHTDSNAESSSCETTAQWKEKLFGEFSPKKET
ncbi:uncharacterized protein MONOS_14107 [Monocercomonoides exilis]|uniref:uncharacterized protein n=1 Tax=Monocercomonoides exilis TaxID=2049356 RepID=UPI0035595B17|nr:hypothetical protein MONOS_14107 [Monocercomonoides exilis]|eukprot:MONOS_14107.1-p1 / transcript=MONOS_14107.1 / gene=MONOS_14107 / organism=Monocercomonoides_exilis_PA203 / gene_product=unspecified product / transcript_product=unspecified product / location=Mono_scaffold00939:17657-18154(-) / protein_length=165 / sequence_SO=supercontig / SO=protein_coding / is_pseudo=false